MDDIEFSFDEETQNNLIGERQKPDGAVEVRRQIPERRNKNE